MWKTIDQKIEQQWMQSPFTNVYGVGRSLIALSLLLTLLFNQSSLLFDASSLLETKTFALLFSTKISLFQLVETRWVAKLAAILMLMLVVIGWLPRYTGILHWWVSYSMVASSSLIDGGDQIHAILALLLLPVCMLDDRKWVWTKQSFPKDSVRNKSKIMVASIFLGLIKIQVAVIYLHAAVGKCSIKEWQNGTAVFYWFTDPMYGVSATLYPFVLPLLQNSFVLTFINWGVLVLEYLLFAGLFMKEQGKKYLMVSGILFHVGIAIVHGLISFAIIMTGALILFLRPSWESFRFTIPQLDTAKKGIFYMHTRWKKA